MNDYGLVSVIMPSYNSADYIDESIQSVIDQTYENWELLITDDCSTDDSVAVIERYCHLDKRIRLFRMEKNCGAGVCRNRSISEAQGRFIAFCDSDDQWYADKLEKQLAFMIEKNCALSYTSYMMCNEVGKKVGIVVCKNSETFFSIQCCNGIGCLTAVYDTAKVGKVYMPTIRKRQDWGLWLTILRKCKIAYGLKEPLAVYRLRSNSISNNKLSLVKYNLKVYREILKFSMIKSYFFFFFVFLPSYFMKKIGQMYINR